MEPWKGSRNLRLKDEAFVNAAAIIGCEPDALRAVWEVEAAGRPFRADGSLERRFEPHHMPGSSLTWRDSAKLSHTAREQAFAAACAADLEAALRATSWGAPQIMGFNHKDAGYLSAELMVRAFAEDEAAQLRAFVRIVGAWGLAGALRARDWLSFARRYNGTGQPEEYARRMEAAFQRLTGRASPVVLRVGDRGAPVRRLQAALGIEIDGVFGPETLAAVKRFQQTYGLTVDGVVGALTWEALVDRRDASPVRQETPSEAALSQVERGVAAITAIGGGIEALRRALPDDVFYLAAWAGLAVAAGVGVIWLARKVL